MVNYRNKNIFVSGFRSQVSGLRSKHATCDMRHVTCYCILFVICAFLLGSLMTGCATIKEAAKCIAGVSTKELEDGRKDAIRKTFNYDVSSCYNKVKEILKKMGSYIYAEDPEKRMIAIYVSSEDTTPVGIFLKEIDTNNIQIEVSSPSAYAKEFIAKSLFSVLDELFTIQELEAQINAKKEMENK